MDYGRDKEWWDGEGLPAPGTAPGGYHLPAGRLRLLPLIRGEWGGTGGERVTVCG